MASSLKGLVEQSKRLVAHVDTHGLPLLQRGVEQIDEISRKMFTKATRATTADASRNKAQYLLAQAGFDAERMNRTLASIEVRPTSDAPEPLAETDVAGFLRQHHHMVVLGTIEEAKRHAVDDFQKANDAALDREWALMKEDMLQALSAQGRSGSGPSIAGDEMELAMPSRGPQPGHELDARMLGYARQVSVLNQLVREGTPPAVATAFLEHSETAPDLADQTRRNVVDMWQLVKSIVHEKETRGWDFPRKIVSAKEYEAGYLSNDSATLRKLMKGAKGFLEDQHLEVMRSFIASAVNFRQAQHGGGLRVIDDVKAFLNVRYDHPGKAWPQEMEAIDQDDYPVYALIFYCLRCGDYKGALDVAQENEDLLGAFTGFFSEYMNTKEHRLSSNTRQRVISEYHNIERTQRRDPYKQILYNIIGRCDAKRTFTNICTTAQDYMWLRLMLVSVDETPDAQFAGYELPLPELQATIVQYGAAHFSPQGRSPLLYFQMLMLSLQFERAVNYLFGVDHLRVEAVHVGIALNHYGLLRQPNNDQIEMFTTSGGKAYLHFGKMIRSYVRMFSRTDPKEALQYFCTIRDAEFKFACIRTLVLESKEFDALLGRRTVGGQRQMGVISQIMAPEDVRRITFEAARESATNGHYSEAVKLFDLAEEYDEVVQLLLRLLDQVLPTPAPTRAELQALATQVFTSYRDSGVLNRLHDVRLATSLELMLNLAVFFDLYHASRFENALQLLTSLNIIPTDSRTVESKATAARDLPVAVQRNLGPILLAAMTSTQKLFTSVKQSSGSGQGDLIQMLRERSHAMVTYAGMIQYHLPPDCVARLIRMDVFMR